jgi:hypothetical protein
VKSGLVNVMSHIWPSLLTDFVCNEGAPATAPVPSYCPILVSQALVNIYQGRTSGGIPISSVSYDAPTPSHCQHISCPVLPHLIPDDHGPLGSLTLTTHSSTGGSLATLAASSLKAWLRALTCALLWPPHPAQCSSSTSCILNPCPISCTSLPNL